MRLDICFAFLPLSRRSTTTQIAVHAVQDIGVKPVKWLKSENANFP